MENRQVCCTWQEYTDLCEQLVAEVALDGWKFDSILCLSRGGLRPGDVFSRVYDMPLAVMAASSYREAAGTEQGELSISSCIAGLGVLAGRLLLVDDLCDSGRTIAAVRELLLKEFPAITEIRVAVIWMKARSVITPDYCVVRFRDDPWIQQPFEIYDAMGADALLERRRAVSGTTP